MEFEETELTKIEKFKQHIKDNKKIYIGTTIGIVTGSIITALFIMRKYGMTDMEMEEHVLISIKQRLLANYKPTVHNNTYQTISQYGNPIGRPGTPVVDTTTWKRFESESLAARSVGASVTKVSDHLNGRREHVNGHTFKRVSDYVPE